MIHALIAALSLAVAQPGYDAMMKALHVAGMQVLVMDHGKIVSNDAYGVKDLKTNQPVGLHTHFEIGSITKQFTAAAIMQLSERGKLSLDDHLGKYIPQYAAGKDITLRQMLLQISGIPNYTDVKGFSALIVKRGGRYVFARDGDLRSVLGLIAGKQLDFIPGSKWEYSNSNYYFLGRVVEIASGKPWQTYIQNHIFKAAGMNESSFMENEANIADMATGYTSQKGSAVPTGTFRGWAGGAGSIVSTASDLAKWDTALLGGKIVSENSRKMMMSPGGLPALDKARYGFGWVVDTYDGQQRIWHNGGTLGFNSSNQYYPALSQIVIVLSSGPGGADSIAQHAFEALHPDLAAANNTAAAGEDPVTTQRSREIWAELLAGKPDPSQFTPETLKAFTPDVLAGARAQFAQLGDIKTWVYSGKKAGAASTAYTYRVTFSSGTALNVNMVLNKDGKVTGYYATP